MPGHRNIELAPLLVLWLSVRILLLSSHLTLLEALSLDSNWDLIKGGMVKNLEDKVSSQDIQLRQAVARMQAPPKNRKEGILELANTVRSFRDDCERILAAMTLSKRQPNKDEVWIIQFYCNQLLSKINPNLPQQPSTD